MAINGVTNGVGSPVTPPASAVTSVALQDKLARCTRQLGDWEACASSKTPEGKKIIQNLRAQIGNLESRISAQTTRPAASSANTAAGPAPAPASASASASAPAWMSTLGVRVNAFA